MKTLRRVARIKRFRSLVLDMPTTGADDEDTVRITIQRRRGRHRAVEDDSRPEQRSVWALREKLDAGLWDTPGPQHLRDREAAPEGVAA